MYLYTIIHYKHNLCSDKRHKSAGVRATVWVPVPDIDKGCVRYVLAVVIQVNIKNIIQRFWVIYFLLSMMI